MYYNIIIKKYYSTSNITYTKFYFKIRLESIIYYRYLCTRFGDVAKFVI
jgi:hypothetical protein